MHEAVKRALDWLEANPDKHITGTLAVDQNGDRCLPTSKKADCFCALGRIAKEANLTRMDNDYRKLNKFFGSSMVTVDVWSLNDNQTLSKRQRINQIRELLA